jgi:hypothetical protein
MWHFVCVCVCARARACVWHVCVWHVFVRAIGRAERAGRATGGRAGACARTWACARDLKSVRGAHFVPVRVLALPRNTGAPLRPAPRHTRLPHPHWNGCQWHPSPCHGGP